jgi:hypothetical protein
VVAVLDPVGEMGESGTYKLEERQDMMLWLWLWLLVAMVAGCGFTVADKGSDVNISGISLSYTDWVAPAESNWQKDSYECERDAREAYPSLFRVPGRRQMSAERCLIARGYVKR